jgi:ketosteroid isomerase-like protein
MIRSIAIAAAVLLTALTALVPEPAAPQPIPPALAAMADTEREFAKAATAKGWRDAFLEFFADDAVAFTPDVVPAKDRLRKQPSTPFSEFELVWEPRTGDVAASGDLGWLTGPSTSINHKANPKAPDAGPRHGCYLSIWRRQPDGRWRVIVDVGVDSPTPVPFPEGFTRSTISTHFTGSEKGEPASTSLTTADRELNAQIAASGFAAAFSSRLSPLSRLHRPGHVPMVGPPAIEAWLKAQAQQGSAEFGSAAASLAGDFGYTHGRFTVTSPAPTTGVYIRLWSRDASGRWWVMADVAQTFKPPR